MCAGLRYVRYVRTVQYQLLTPFLVEDLSVGMKVSAIFVKPSTQCRVRCAVCGVRCAVCQCHMPSADRSGAEKRPTHDPTAKRTKKFKEEKKGKSAGEWTDLMSHFTTEFL